MAYTSVISYQASYVMQLINTCTGQPIRHPRVEAKHRGATLSTVLKPDGFCVILNVDEDTLFLTLQVAGYETQTLQVEKTVRWDRPTLVHMVPEVSRSGLQTHLTLEGQLPGLTHISGVFLSNYILRFKNYTSKTKKMALFNRHNKPLSRIHHGLLSVDESSFIPFAAYPQRSVEEVLVEEFDDSELPAVNAPIAPLIVGTVYPDGRYLFRVTDDSSNLCYLLRFVVDGTTYFQRVDFHSKEKIVLERGEIL
ncbi:MAG: hypothetical protein R3Y62_00660 [Eubacteriales bacterium]